MNKRKLAEGTRVPIQVNGIQVNFCKNPTCANFGVPAAIGKQSRGRYTSGRPDAYTLNSDMTKEGISVPRLQCQICGEKPPVKSNLAIERKSNRMLGYLAEKPIGCPDPKCPNHLINITAGKIYYSSFGTTKSGSHRYRCKLCETTFSVGAPTKQQRQPHKNIQVFRLLVNKMPLKRYMRPLTYRCRVFM